MNTKVWLLEKNNCIESFSPEMQGYIGLGLLIAITIFLILFRYHPSLYKSECLIKSLIKVEICLLFLYSGFVPKLIIIAFFFSNSIKLIFWGIKNKKPPFEEKIEKLSKTFFDPAKDRFLTKTEDSFYKALVLLIAIYCAYVF